MECYVTKKNIFLSILFALLFSLIFAFITTDIFKKNFYRVDIEGVYKEKQLLPIVYYIVDNEKDVDKNKTYKKLISHDNVKYIESFDIRNIKNIVFYLEYSKKNFSLESIKIQNSFFTKNINANDIVKYFNSYNVVMNNGYLVSANSNEISFLEGNSNLEQYISNIKGKINRNLILSIIFIIIPLSILLFYLIYKNINKLFIEKDRIKAVNFLTYTFIFIVILFIYSTITIMYRVIDDYTFIIKPQESKSLIEYSINFYKEWNNRYLSGFLVVFFLKYNIIFFTVINSLLTLLMYIYGGKIVSLLTKEKYSSLYSLLLFALTLLIEHKVLWLASFWVVGAPNYLWGISCSVIIMYFMLKIALDNVYIKIYHLIILIPIALIAANTEQSGLVLFVLSLLLLIYTGIKKQINYQFIILFVTITVSLGLNIFSPGISIRFDKEVATWYPQFNNFSYFIKGVYGYPYTILYFIFKISGYTTIVTGLLIVLYSFKIKSNYIIKILTILSLIFSILIFMPNIIQLNYLRASTSMAGGGFSVTQIKEILLISFELMLYIAIIAYLLKDNLKILFITMLVLFASITSSFILSFSPTIFASSFRIFYIPAIIYIFVSAIIFSKLISNSDIYKNKDYIYLYAGLCGLIIYFSYKMYKYSVFLFANYP